MGGARGRDGGAICSQGGDSLALHCGQRSAGKRTLANGITSGARAGTRRPQKGIFKFYCKKNDDQHTQAVIPARGKLPFPGDGYALGWKRGGVRTPLSSQDARGRSCAPLPPLPLCPAPSVGKRRRRAAAAAPNRSSGVEPARAQRCRRSARQRDATVPPLYS